MTAKKNTKKRTTKKKTTKKTVKKRRISHRGARNKGLSFEREISNIFKPFFQFAKRHLEFQKDEARYGVDISNTGKLRIQCKANVDYCPISKLEEVNASLLEKGEMPVLITKGNQKAPVVVMYLDDFLEILEGTQLI